VVRPVAAFAVSPCWAHARASASGSIRCSSACSSFRALAVGRRLAPCSPNPGFAITFRPSFVAENPTPAETVNSAASATPMAMSESRDRTDPL